MHVRFKQPLALQQLFEVREPGARPMVHPQPQIVDLDLSKIDALLSTATFGYVGPRGSDFKAEKHARVSRMIEAGEEIEMPIMSAALTRSTEDFQRSVRVLDGRHRLWNLHNMGYKRVNVVVPQFQATLFMQVFG